ncbi:GntR family transcriptional regulator [Dactylosporangium fulvum]|uniref:GntR family transcriptional regulator n=1 Tax=Dactylosporangium fulvum TaxID=53359 RepID=A0ABY5VPU4_9ACTN|nr:GntR family transcriptional regulator [Dactylosporangium fulvum]UWP79787.1 GntR family transcriptional regulator [Dactylosporangium fulvum]
MADAARGVVTAQDAALARLRDRLARGVLRPGDQIRQEVLAAELGLSVVPVREALKTLEVEGQVSYYRHRGYFVAQLDLDELTETYRIRALLEGEAMARAVARIGRDDLDRLREAIRDIDTFARSQDIAAVTAANRRFHFTLFEAAEMPRMTNFIRMLWDSTDAYRSLYFADAAHLRLINTEHRRILRAVREGDVAAAVELSAAHRENALAALGRLLADTP